ncbi:NPC intracellular cholesterol transporter 2 homolog a-like [Anopheles albimanus]|uniref:ML domain-containing protein n=1 Tax=Anopheles albimanus TaxID=7167 RepID=A0A182FR20_ANOAL|nr:NPC intracellular cholesterol transporter 2 homolog a-like [Anopheles albimanus]
MWRPTVLLVSLVVFTGLTEGLQTRPCSNGQPQPSLVMIADCCEMPCNMVRGTEEQMLIQFDSPFNSKTLRYEKVSTILGVIAPYPLPEELSNTCNWLSGASCPIAQGQKITATFNCPILPIYPLVSVSNEISVIDEEGRVVACFVYDGQLVPAQN